MLKSLSALAALAVLVGLHGAAAAQSTTPLSAATGLCGELESSFGPFDYRTMGAEPKHLVESAHFTPRVETLRSGNTSTIGGDLNYTLRAIPNHHRALAAMVRLGERTRSTQPPGARYPIECYFDRAERFAPDDAMVYVLYGIYLAKAARNAEAEVQLKLAQELNAEKPDARIVYNLGIGYLELKQFERASEFAKKAEAMGIQFPGLRQRLQRAGKWPN